MPNTGDFDPAKAIQGLRQAEEAEKQRVKAQEDLRRANILKLLRYADEQLADMHDPVVSEFVVTERWSTTERISAKRAPQLRAGQRIVSTEDGGSFFRPRTMYTVATGHERQTRYYGSWLSLEVVSLDARHGLVKLLRPRAGYARVSIHTGNHSGWDPHNVGYLEKEGGSFLNTGSFLIFASLEEATEVKEAMMSRRTSRTVSVEQFTEPLTKAVRQALDYVATGQPPERPPKPPREDGN